MVSCMALTMHRHWPTKQLNISICLQLLCNSGEYRQALHLLTDALSLAHTSSCSNDIRLGIAACYMKLGELDMARLAYERILAVDSNCARGYMGLAAVGLIGSSNSDLSKCLEFLQRAHKLDPYLPQLNAILSQLSLVRGDSQAALEHAQLAVRQLLLHMFVETQILQ